MIEVGDICMAFPSLFGDYPLHHDEWQVSKCYFSAGSLAKPDRREDQMAEQPNTAETPIHPAHQVVSYSSLRYRHLEAKGVTRRFD
jgi:hypothetical protein